MLLEKYREIGTNYNLKMSIMLTNLLTMRNTDYHMLLLK